ncbi:sugar kinase [Thalassotalea hakodatensis]|uniref:sugar kinase n=1 Tax=Thalassotalea hakodatensis TaxID=3030492 RepID=UPI002572ACFC|nr:sugar kinase [Thalassotalea hakodatensis]
MIEDHSDGLFRFGGDTLNTALYLARLTENVPINVAFATSIGIDLDSNLLLAAWKKEGIDTRFVTQLVDKFPGRYRIKTDKQGERSFKYQRSNSAARYYLTSSPGALTRFIAGRTGDYLYVSGISLAIISPEDRVWLFDALARFKANGGKVIFDNNYRPVLWNKKEVLPTYQSAMALADIAFLTDEDEFEIYQDNSLDGIISRAKQYNTTETIIKRGSEPCIIINSQGEQQAVSAEPVTNLVDTCAAGDAFAAGYLSQRLQHASVEHCAQFAHRVAGRVIQYSGAIVDRKVMADLF